MLASSGWICCENTSLVSQAGCVDASHSEHTCACRRREATCLAGDSGLIEGCIVSYDLNCGW